MLTTATAISVGTVAGCLGGTNEKEDEDIENDISEVDRRLAAEMAETIDDDLSVTGWELPGMFIPEYTDSRGVEVDATILGNAYADIVDQGFDRRAMPTALTDDGDVYFMVFIEPEWANAYLEGDWSQEAYDTEIEDSAH
ncbi:hypothetical protein ACFR99_13070 [Haloarchaeobius amylolyticus]|uniref:DUF8159 domain-containing protein n=1 Tax=Haloarchaeobius amylolyticus TaxID=1198296 RepID=A0ABD6BIT9_9EURY